MPERFYEINGWFNVSLAAEIFDLSKRRIQQLVNEGLERGLLRSGMIIEEKSFTATPAYLYVSGKHGTD